MPKPTDPVPTSRRLFGALAASLAAAALAGCSATTADVASVKKGSARAALDPSRGHISYPLDRFGPTDAERAAHRRHADSVLAACMKEASPHGGLDLPSPAEERPEDRPYGIWHAENAAEHGYSLPARKDAVSLEQADSAARKAYLDCAESLPQKAGRLDGVDSTSLSERLRARAYNAAAHDPAWSETVKAWKGCLKDAGHSISDDPERWVPEGVFASPHEAVRIAVADVSCKRKHDVVQRLADLESAYQDTLITANKAELVQQRKRIEEQVRTSREHLSGGEASARKG